MVKRRREFLGGASVLCKVMTAERAHLHFFEVAKSELYDMEHGAWIYWKEEEID